MAKHEAVPSWLCLSLLFISLLSCASITLSVWLTFRVNIQQATIEHQALEISTLKEQMSFKLYLENLERMMQREVLSNEEGSSNSLEAVLQQLSSQGGVAGPPGPPGPPGAVGQPGRDGRDAVNFQAVDLHINHSVTNVVGKEMAKVRLAANEIPTVAGATYVRWGRTSCPEKSSLIYKGLAAGNKHRAIGGTTSYACLPDDPEYSGGFRRHGQTVLTAVEYRDKDKNLDESAPCVVCQAGHRPSKLMIPAKLRCPDSSWTLEYNGFLMTEHVTFQKAEHVCVDMQRESRPGAPGANDGAYFYPMYADCEGVGNLFHCPPYVSVNAINCVVCTK